MQYNIMQAAIHNPDISSKKSVLELENLKHAYNNYVNHVKCFGLFLGCSKVIWKS